MAQPRIADLLAPLLDAFTGDDLAVLTGVVVAVADADEVIDEDERAALKEVFETAFGSELTDYVITALIDDAAQRIADEGLSAFAASLGAKLRERSRVEEGIRLAIAIGRSNAEYKPEERGVVQALADAGGISAERLTALSE